MKKLFISMLVLAASLNVMAEITAKAKITLTATGTNKTDVVYLVQNSDLNDGYNTGSCSLVPSLDTKAVAFYVYYNNAEYISFGTKDLGEMTFGLKTNADTEYTLTVSQVGGTETLTMLDSNTSSTFELTEGATYNFTATANTTDNTRFHLAAAPVPATPEICHRYGKLEVRGSKGMTVQVLNLDGSATSIADQTMATDNEVIDLSGLTAGQYLVKWNGKELIIQM